MSLLTQASLVITPNGYKEGKLYSVIPSDGSGDMSVTRATTATRVNSQGLVELVPYNLLAYSEDFTNADWQKYQLSVTANQTTAPNGTNTADLITQTGAYAGSFYKYPYEYFTGVITASCYFKKGTGNVAIIEGNPPSGGFSVLYNLDTEVITPSGTGYISTNIENLNNGWYRCSVVANGNGTGYISFGSYNSNGSTMYAWGAQLNDGTIKDYQKTETRLNIPRLDYSNGTCPSILVEPQRTNSCLYSNTFTNGVWGVAGYGNAATIVANNAIGPDGNMSASKATFTAGATQGRLVQSIVVTPGAAYNASFYVKKGNKTTINFYSDAAVFGTFITFNFDTGTITNANNVYGQSVTDVGNGWYRLSFLTYTPSPVAQFGFITFGGEDGFCYIYGAQLEAGSYATSYIPTTSASVTRNADVISKTGISSLIGQQEGTIFLDFYYDGSVNNHMIIRDNGYSSYIYFNSASANQLWGQIQNVGIQFSMSATAGRYKMALAYKSGSSALYVNGAQIGTSATTFTLSGSINILDYTLSTPNNKINASALWKTRLTNAQLATLTTI